MACFCAQGGPAVHGQHSCASPRAGFAGLPRHFCVDPQKYLRVAGEDSPQGTYRRRAKFHLKRYPSTTLPTSLLPTPKHHRAAGEDAPRGGRLPNMGVRTTAGVSAPPAYACPASLSGGIRAASLALFCPLRLRQDGWHPRRHRLPVCVCYTASAPSALRSAPQCRRLCASLLAPQAAFSLLPQAAVQTPQAVVLAIPRGCSGPSRGPWAAAGNGSRASRGWPRPSGATPDPTRRRTRTYGNSRKRPSKCIFQYFPGRKILENAF